MSQCDLFGERPHRPPANQLETFCRTVAARYRGLPYPPPEELADQFRGFFRIVPPVSLPDQIRLAKRLGMQPIKFVAMPDNLSGTNSKFDDEYALFVNELHSRVRQVHTIFHEIYESIHHRLQEIMPKYRKPPPRQCEQAADEFAACVLMPSENFLKDVLESGLDVFLLQQKYRRSYSSTLIRTARVLQAVGIPFLGLLYEDLDYENVLMARPSSSDVERRIPAGMRLRYCWATLGLSRKINPVFTAHLPRRGERVVPGALAWLAFEHCRPVHLRCATGFDFFGLDDLTLLIRPVVWSGSAIAKVVITGVRSDQRLLLGPQLARTECKVVDHRRGLFAESPRETQQLPLFVPLDSHRLRSELTRVRV